MPDRDRDRQAGGVLLRDRMPQPKQPMDPERWRHIERLYHSALERPSRERDAFLESECRGDDGLRLEVQALLSRAASAENFLDRPAADVAAQMLSQPAAPVLTGLRLGVYEVQAPIGAGGMGVVYRALDTKLNRPVAIKFLSDDLADAGRAPPLPARSPNRLVPQSPAHRDGARRGRVRGPAVSRHRVRRRRHAQGLDARSATAGARRSSC